MHVTLWHFARSTTFGRFTSPARPPQTCPRAPATQRAGGWCAPVAGWQHPGSMRASHSAEGRLEARVVGVLILVQPLAEDGVHDALALLVDQPLHLETLEEERAALGENLLAILGGGSGGGHNHLAGLNGAAQPALAGVAELSHHEQARRQGGRRRSRAAQESGPHQVALGELLGRRPLKVGQVELHATHLRVVERLHLERVLEDQAAALDLAYGTGSVGGERRRHQRRCECEHRSRVHDWLGRQVDGGQLHLGLQRVTSWRLCTRSLDPESGTFIRGEKRTD